MIRKNARARRDFLYRKAILLQNAEVSERRSKLRAALASGRPLDPSVANDKALRKDFQYDESAQDRTAQEELELDDEYQHLSGVVDPRVLITTSRDPSTRLQAFSKEIRLLLPTGIRLNRGGTILPELVKSAQSAGLTDIMVRRGSAPQITRQSLIIPKSCCMNTEASLQASHYRISLLDRRYPFPFITLCCVTIFRIR
jgi:U3 small nucleolar ribonucleoprotein protein IMP4